MSNNATLLLTNAIVLTMDAALTQYEPGAVAVQGDHIAAVGLRSRSARRSSLQPRSSTAAARC